MLKPYEKYQNTEYDWLGLIPLHWQWLYLSQTCTEKKQIKNTGNIEKKVLSLSYGKIVPRKNVDLGLAPKDYSSYQIVDKNDIILRLTDLQNDKKSLRTGLVKERGIITSAYTCLKPFQNAAYLQYLLHSYDTQKVFYGMGGGVRQSIGYKDIRNIRIPFPPREEQDQIVRFLDWKLAKINKLIRAKKKQIALLNEHKQVIINNAITKGLDSKVSMKNSGIEWIGETPTTWKIKRLKNVATTFGRIGFRGYSTVDLVDNEEDGAITTSPSNIKEDSMSFEKCSYLTWEKYEESPEIQLRENDILIVKTGSSYGKTGFIDSLPKKATINPQLLIVRNRSNELHSKFLYFVIKSRYFQDQIKCEIIGSTIPTISETKILSFFLAIPPKDVQEKLLVYIESVIDKHRLAIKKIEDEISLLQEYRIRLISDVVTGKIDVSDIEIPEYETDSDDFTDDEIDDNLVLDEEDGEMEVE